jgi:hypothetical protein
VPQETARDALSSDWFEKTVRFGHAAKGAVFGLIGVLAVRLALHDRSDPPDFPGALESLAEQPLDVLFLGVLASGLLAYAVWRFVLAFADPANHGNSLSGWAYRAIMLGVGLTYLGFATYAVALLLGLRRGEPGLESETATVLGWPGGRWIVGAIAAGVLIAGCYEAFIALTRRYREEFRNVRLARWERGLVHLTGAWGHAARATVYTAAGAFGMKAAINHVPDEAKGFADTLWQLGDWRFGQPVLILVAAGLVAFGAYSLLLAIHRHIPDGSEADEPASASGPEAA